MIAYIDARCLAWAEFSKRKVSSRLGYPRQSAFTRWMPSGTCRVPINEDEVSEIERAVLALDADLRRVVRAMYLESGTAEQHARDLDCCRDTFYARLHRAHVRIMEWLQDHDPVGLPKKIVDAASDTRLSLRPA